MLALMVIFYDLILDSNLMIDNIISNGFNVTCAACTRKRTKNRTAPMKRVQNPVKGYFVDPGQRSSRPVAARMHESTRIRG
jgi:hypothetical protein